MIDFEFREWLDDLRVAVALLTRVPMPHPDSVTPPNLTRAQRLFPLVGVAIGAVIGTVYSLFDMASLPPLASAALAVLRDPAAYDAAVEELRKVRAAVGDAGASARAAGAVLAEVSGQREKGNAA